jgi:hypothetical protein
LLNKAARIGRLEILQHLKPKIRDFEHKNKMDGSTLLISGTKGTFNFRFLGLMIIFKFKKKQSLVVR